MALGTSRPTYSKGHLSSMPACALCRTGGKASGLRRTCANSVGVARHIMEGDKYKLSNVSNLMRLALQIIKDLRPAVMRMDQELVCAFSRKAHYDMLKSDMYVRRRAAHGG